MRQNCPYESSPAARHYHSALSIWLSVDPMVDKYPGVRPYVYCGNNPVRLVDEDGREVFLIGTHHKAAFKNMQQGTNLRLSMGKWGKITAEGEAISEADEKLLEAINSKSVSSIVLCSDKGQVGSYMGSTYKKDRATSINSVNVPEMIKFEQANEAPIGSGIIHEVTEGYYAGQIAIKTKHSIRAASVHEAEPPTPLTLGNVQLSMQYADILVPDYPRDYKKYKMAHNKASLPPNEMSNFQKSNYKNPSAHYIVNKYLFK